MSHYVTLLSGSQKLNSESLAVSLRLVCCRQCTSVTLSQCYLHSILPSPPRSLCNCHVTFLEHSYFFLRLVCLTVMSLCKLLCKKSLKKFLCVNHCEKITVQNIISIQYFCPLDHFIVCKCHVTFAEHSCFSRAFAPL